MGSLDVEVTNAGCDHRGRRISFVVLLLAKCSRYMKGAGFAANKKSILQRQKKREGITKRNAFICWMRDAVDLIVDLNQRA